MQAPAQIISKKRTFNWFPLVIAEYTICTLGHFAVMAILSLYFLMGFHLSAAQAGWLLLFTSLSFRLSRIFLAPLVNKLPIRVAVCLALFVTSLGYIGMALVKNPLFVLPILLTVGIGHGTNTLLVKIMTANARKAKTEQTSDKEEKAALFFRYASLTTGINISAAIGSFVGSFLLFRASASGVFLLAALMYALSGCIALWIPSQEAGGQQSPDWGKGLRLSLRMPALWRAMAFGALGWFMYTQSYASLPLFVSEAVHRKDLLGSFFVVNAVLVVVGQLPISQLLVRLRVPTSQIVLLAFLVFAAGFAVLWLFPVWQLVYVAVALWTLAEILLMPALDTLVAEGALAEHKQIAFTLNSVAVGLGEGIGNFIGVSLAGWLVMTGKPGNLYLFLMLGALVAMVSVVFLGNRRESMVHRLLHGQSLIPTWQTTMLPELSPVTPVGTTQKLLAWFSAPSYHEERSFLEMHPEIVTLETGQLDALIQQELGGQKPETQMLADRLYVLQNVKKKISEAVSEVYVNLYGGLVLNLPPWLEEIKAMLVQISETERPEQSAIKRIALLNQAIQRVKAEHGLAPEVLAELQVLYVIACLEAPAPEHERAIETAIDRCKEALQVYTLARYPYQFARTQVFLSLAYQNRVRGQRVENLQQALRCYEAAAAADVGGKPVLELASSNLTGKPGPSQHALHEKQHTLEEAIQYCQEALQQCMRESELREQLSAEKTQLLTPLAVEAERDTRQQTLMGLRFRQGRALDTPWIAQQTTPSSR